MILFVSSTVFKQKKGSVYFNVCCFVRHVPWPIGPKHNLFMIPLEKESLGMALELIREEQRRWHPDKFQVR